MANEIKLTLKVDDKGGLSIVGKKAKKTKDEVEKLNKAQGKLGRQQDAFHKKEKALTQGTLSQGRAMSKLNQTIGSGSSGLVGAYAVLAANVFAATAAFGVFQRAAQFDQLIAGLNFVGNAAGANLGVVADRLKEITGAAVSTEQAMRATAQAVSSGISTEQLVGLTKIAKGASLALGRNLPDALDRLVRGVAKLEPEILDELGIFVRIDDAVRTYAAGLGKAESSLTQYERRQAFANATLEQGSKKFFDIAEAIDTNPYDKLAASLANLQKELVGILNNFAGLSTVVDFFARNLSALAAVAGAVAAPLIKSIAPALFSLDTRAAAAADSFAAQNIAMLSTTASAGKVTKTYADAVDSIAAGEDVATNFARAQKELEISDQRINKVKERQTKIFDKHNKKLSSNTKSVDSLTKQQRALNAIKAQALKGDKADLASALKGNKIANDKRTTVGKLVASLRAQGNENVNLANSLDKVDEASAKVNSNLEKATGSSTKFQSAVDGSQGKLNSLNKQLEINKQNAQGLDNATKAVTKSTFLHTRASAISKAAQGDLKGSFTDLRIATNEYGRSLTKVDKTGRRVNKSFIGVRKAFFMAASGARVFGAALMTALPFLLTLISVGTILFSLIKDKFFPEDVVKERIDKAIKSFSSFAEIQNQFVKTVKGDENELSMAYIAYSGVLKQVEDQLVAVQTEQRAQTVLALQGQDDIIAKAEKQKKLIEEGKVRSGKDSFFFAAMAGILGANEAMPPAISDQKSLLKEQGDIIEAALKRREELVTQQTALEADAMKATLEGAVQMLKIQNKIATQRGEVDPFNLSITQRNISAFEDLISELGDVANATNPAERLKEIMNTYHEITVSTHDTAMAFKEIQAAVAETNITISKEFEQAKKPVEDLGNNIASLDAKFEGLRKRRDALLDERKNIPNKFPYDTTTIDREIKETDDLIAQLAASTNDLNVAEGFKGSEENIAKLNARIKEFQDETFEGFIALQRLTQETKNFTDAAKGVEGTEVLQLETQNTLIRDRIAQLQLRLNLEREILNSTKEGTEERRKTEAEIAKLKAQIAGDDLLIIARQKDLITQKQRELSIEKEIAKTQEMAARLDIKLSNLEGRITPEQELKIATETANAKIKAAQIEGEVAQLRLQIEYAIMEARFKSANSLGGTEITDEEQAVLGLLQLQLEANVKITNEKIKQANLSKLELIRSGGRGAAGTNPFVAAQNSQAGNITEILRTGTEQIGLIDEQKDLASKVIKEQEQAALTAQGRMLFSGMVGQTNDENKYREEMEEANENVRRATEFLESIPARTLAAQGAAIGNLFQELGRQMQELGPEGKIGGILAQSIGISFANITANIGLLQEGAEHALSNTAAKLSMVSSVVSGLQSVLNAASQQRIQNIENEIQAEKDRDGQSAKSVQRIKALESQKDAIARKSFETNKKLMMAQTVINTAAAVVGILAAESKLGAPVAIALASAVGALGLAQLAIIAGTSYQSTASGSGGDISAPTAVGMGQRSNVVDVSQRASGGELAYLRGARGMGTNANDFTPAFYGKKMRAVGGAVAGYTVGEQGPELFIPEVPGTIVPNDDVAMGQNVNVSFNVQAIDASSFNDALTVQRGNIISIIREAANGYGEGFLEQVDVESLKMET